MNILLISIVAVFIVLSLTILIYNRSFYTQASLFIFSGIERLSLVLLGATITPILLFGSMFSFQSLYSEIREKKNIKMPRPLLLCFLLIIVSCLVTSAFSPYKRISLKAAMYYGIYIILIIGEYIYIRKQKQIAHVIKAVLIGVGLFVLFGLVQEIRFLLNLYPDLIAIPFKYNNALSPLDFIITTGKHTYLRPNSGFNDVNTAAGFLMLYLPLLLIETYRKWKSKVVSIWIRLFFIFFSFCTLLLLIAMRSRSSYVAVIILTIVGIVGFYLKRIEKRKIITILFVIVGISLMLFIFIERSAALNLFMRTYTKEYSTQAHIFYSQAAIQEFTAFPLFGGGVGSFAAYYQTQLAAGKVPYAASVDNPPLLLKLLAEDGLVGLFAFGTLLVYPIINMIKVYPGIKDLSQKLFILSMSIGYIALLSANLLHAYFFLFFTAIFLGLYLGALEMIVE